MLAMLSGECRYIWRLQWRPFLALLCMHQIWKCLHIPIWEIDIVRAALAEEGSRTKSISYCINIVHLLASQRRGGVPLAICCNGQPKQASHCKYPDGNQKANVGWRRPSVTCNCLVLLDSTTVLHASWFFPTCVSQRLLLTCRTRVAT